MLAAFHDGHREGWVIVKREDALAVDILTVAASQLAYPAATSPFPDIVVNVCALVHGSHPLDSASSGAQPLAQEEWRCAAARSEGETSIVQCSAVHCTTATLCHRSLPFPEPGLMWAIYQVSADRVVVGHGSSRRFVDRLAGKAQGTAHDRRIYGCGTRLPLPVVRALPRPLVTSQPPPPTKEHCTPRAAHQPQPLTPISISPGNLRNLTLLPQIARLPAEQRASAQRRSVTSSANYVPALCFSHQLPETANRCVSFLGTDMDRVSVPKKKTHQMHWKQTGAQGVRFAHDLFHHRPSWFSDPSAAHKRTECHALTSPA